ncbi:MAG: hypothetical protein IJ070_01215, partial [Firmicutes bacterium]|nr:hypothetical protein [Bacillota bacterium]
MRRDKDFEYIQKMFDEDGIKAPESLSEENMRRLLDSAEAKTTTATDDGTKVSVNLTGLEAEKTIITDDGTTTIQKLRTGKRWRRSAFALAACAVLVIGLIPVT